MAVPLLAIAGSWPLAAVSIVAERTGKAIRSPARDPMLSHAAADTGRGWAFGVHESLDQIGAVIGPLVVAGVLDLTGSYRLAFAWLTVPAALAIAALLLTRVSFPDPRALEPASPQIERGNGGRLGVGPTFWVYLVGGGLIGAGFADFALIAFHLEAASLVPLPAIPLLYAFAMGVDAVAALGLGRLYDRHGGLTLGLVGLVSGAATPLVFLGGAPFAAVGIGLWGIGKAARESVIRSVVADLVPTCRRGSAYGVFDTGYGLAWFAGSATMGLLYGVSLTLLVVFAVVAELAAIPVVLTGRHRLA